MEAIQALIERVDRWQQRHTATAVVWAVNKKYGDDRGGYLAALIAYYGFISLFPLMLAFFSVAAWLLPGHTQLLQSLDKQFGNFPVLGPSIKELQGHRLSGSPYAVAFGLLGLLWGATGLANTLQHTMDEAWNVPGRDRENFFKKLWVSLKWFAVFGVGVLLSTTITSLSQVFDWGPAGPVLAALPALVVNVGIYLLSFRVFTRHEIGWRKLMPGAVVGGLAWTVLTTVGINLLTRQVKHASALYGTIGTTLGFIAFIYLIGRLSLYGAELNVVLDRHLWPRTITSPPLTTADKRQLIDVAKREERVQDETVRVEF